MDTLTRLRFAEEAIKLLKAGELPNVMEFVFNAGIEFRRLADGSVVEGENLQGFENTVTEQRA